MKNEDELGRVEAAKWNMPSDQTLARRAIEAEQAERERRQKENYEVFLRACRGIDVAPEQMIALASALVHRSLAVGFPFPAGVDGEAYARRAADALTLALREFQPTA